MKSMRGSARTRAYWMNLTALCGALCALTAAADASPIRVGTVLGIPLSHLNSFRLANATWGVDLFGQRVSANDVTVLHVSWGIATVSITSKLTGQKAWRVYFPANVNGGVSSLYTWINGNDFFSNARRIRGPFGTVVQVDVRQRDTGDAALEDTRFLLVPANSGVFQIDSANPQARITRIHLQRVLIGSQSIWVELIGIDRDSADSLRIESRGLLRQIQALNNNVSIRFVSRTDLTEAHLISVR